MKSVFYSASVVVLALGICSVTNAKTIRATEMNAATWSAMSGPNLQETVIEFRQGDRLSVEFSAEGDLLETNQAPSGVIGVKRDFWLRVGSRGLEISLDGLSYRPLNEVVSGSLKAGASGPDGGAANAINLALKAYLK